jgi:hypothetical protein
MSNTLEALIGACFEDSGRNLDFVWNTIFKPFIVPFWSEWSLPLIQSLKEGESLAEEGMEKPKPLGPSTSLFQPQKYSITSSSPKTLLIERSIHFAEAQQHKKENGFVLACKAFKEYPPIRLRYCMAYSVMSCHHSPIGNVRGMGSSKRGASSDSSQRTFLAALHYSHLSKQEKTRPEDAEMDSSKSKGKAKLEESSTPTTRKILSQQHHHSQPTTPASTILRLSKEGPPCKPSTEGLDAFLSLHCDCPPTPVISPQKPKK